jgi:hypothetical protein
LASPILFSSFRAAKKTEFTFPCSSRKSFARSSIPGGSCLKFHCSSYATEICIVPFALKCLTGTEGLWGFFFLFLLYSLIFSLSGKHEFIGSFSTNVADLQNVNGNKRFGLINQELKQKKKNYINSGTVVIDSFDTVKQHSFLDYIRGGCEINLITAIDFTASNGNPMNKDSLHFCGGTGLNAYARVRRTFSKTKKDGLFSLTLAKRQSRQWETF